MELNRLSLLISQIATLRDRALVECRPVEFQKLDRAILRIYAAIAETKRGNHSAARAFVWSARDLLSMIHA